MTRWNPTPPASQRRAASKLGASLVLVALLAMGAETAAARQKLPEVTHDGLHLVEGTGFQAFYMKPGASLAGYDQLKILECFVAFKKHWQQEQMDRGARLVTPRVMDEIKQGLSKEFHAVFVKEMQREGPYRVVDETGPKVLILRPAIIDLDVEVPDAMDEAGETTFAASSGQMTLYLELYDSVTSDLIARLIDSEADPGLGTIEWQNSVTNREAADRILKRWADRLRALIETATKHAANGGKAS